MLKTWLDAKRAREAWLTRAFRKTEAPIRAARIEAQQRAEDEEKAAEERRARRLAGLLLPASTVTSDDLEARAERRALRSKPWSQKDTLLSERDAFAMQKYNTVAIGNASVEWSRKEAKLRALLNQRQIRQNRLDGAGRGGGNGKRRSSMRGLTSSVDGVGGNSGSAGRAKMPEVVPTTTTTTATTTAAGTIIKSSAEREGKEIEAGIVPRRITREILSTRLRALRKAHVKLWIAQQDRPDTWTSDDVRNTLRSSEVAALPRPKAFHFLPLREMRRALPDFVRQGWAQAEAEQRALLSGGDH